MILDLLKVSKVSFSVSGGFMKNLEVSAVVMWNFVVKTLQSMPTTAKFSSKILIKPLIKVNGLNLIN